MEFKKRDLLVEDNSEEGIFKKVMSKLKDVKDRAQSEIKETRALVRILTYAVKSYAKDREFDLNDKDRKFIKGQSADVIRGLILAIVAIIPLPIPLTPFLIIFGKKLGIDLTPKEHEIPHKGKSKKEKLEESKLNIILTEDQYQELNEMVQKYESIIHKLCVTQNPNSPFCRLNKMRNELSENNQVDLDVSIEVLDDYFRFKTVGMFPRIVELALQDEGRTATYLKLIADFIEDDAFDKTKTKKVLNKQRNSEEIPADLEELLKMARTLEHQKYEESFVGDHFDKHATFLSLNYSCDDDIRETLFTILTKVKSKERTLDIVFEKMIQCIQKSLTQGIYYLKSDLVTKKDLVFDDEVIFPSGTFFEVKKMDPFIDSYLSEFFSIFKQSDKSKFKGEYVGIYNELIQRVYEWLINSQEAKDYLDKVKSQIGGIIYEYQTIIPIEYIDLYWSNKGQRGCDEKRLSIRFRIKPGFNEIKTFRFKKQDELEMTIKKVQNDEDKKVICT
jgi:hypothetical protein